MLKQVATFVTTVDVIRAMGIVPDKWLTWRVGGLMAHWYARHCRYQPHKDNGPKTNSGGSHCFAHYPLDMVPQIESFVRMCKFERERQGELFDPPPADFEIPPEVLDGGNGTGLDVPGF